MKKLSAVIAFILACTLMFTLAGCGSKAKEAVESGLQDVADDLIGELESALDELETELEEIPAESILEEAESRLDEALGGEVDPAELTAGHPVSDGSHYVILVGGIFLSYEFSGDTITGLKGYVDVGSAELAAETKDSYVDDDPDVESVDTDGSWIILTYKPSGYESLTVSSLDAVFADSKVTE